MEKDSKHKAVDAIPQGNLAAKPILIRYLWLKICGGLFGFVVIGGVWCYWVPRLCPFCCCPRSTQSAECEEAEPAAEIVLDDLHAGVWMPMEGTWIDDPGLTAVCATADTDTNGVDVANFGQCGGTYKTGELDADYRHGVLIQLGHILHPTLSPAGHFQSVTLTYSDDTAKELFSDDFDWIDVLHTGEPCAIDPFHAYSLFDLDTNVVSVACDAATVDVGTATTATFDGTSCLRNRSIHASFKPDVGAITYWSGADGYEVEVEEHEGGDHTHIGHTFNLTEAVNVDVWKDGCFRKRHERVKKIRIVYVEGGSGHSIFHDPIIDGGSITYP